MMTETEPTKLTTKSTSGERGRNSARKPSSASASEVPPRSRFTVKDWVEAALDILVAQSVDQVRVEPLAERLGITKGSFYWHFKDRDALLAAVLEHWVDRATLAIIRRIDLNEQNGSDRLQRLLMLPYETNRGPRGAEVELAIRAWARRSTAARSAIDRVDALRLAYFEQIFAQIGFEKTDAATRSYIAYCYLQSTALIDQDVDVRRAASMLAHGLLVHK